MAEPDLQEIHDFLVALAKKAGDLIIAATPSASMTGQKSNAIDVVTETDVAVEKLVAESLRERYPGYRFLGEETYSPAEPLTDEPTFICDPIDGTTNFIHAHPSVCISLAFTIHKSPLVGVIYQPSHSRLYTAIYTRGAHLNLTTPLPLHPSPAPLTGLRNALIAVEVGHEREGNNHDVKAQTFLKLMGPGVMVQGMRMQGTATLNLCAVAEGSLDLYWEGGPWAWDLAAGVLILREAGGIFADANPGGWEPALDGRKVLAVRGAPAGQRELVEEFWGVVVGRYEF